jgi:hypothetical protein
MTTLKNLRKKESKKQKKMFEALSKSELYFTRGGDIGNKEKDDGNQ